MNAKPNATQQSLNRRLENLVSLRTVTSDAQSNTAAIQGLIPTLERAGMDVVSGSHGGFPYLYAHFYPLTETKIWLYAHMDVVDGTPEQFTLQRRDGRLYGRGTYDMKFALAAYMQLCEELASSRPHIGLIIVSDEEYTGEQGAGYLAPRLELAGKSVIIPDGGAPWSIESTAKGMVWVHLEARGVAAHASRIELGYNAIEKVWTAAQAIKAELGAGDGRDFGDTTVNIGAIHGGEAANQVPHEARLDLDIRFVPPLTLEEVEAKLHAVAARTSVSLTTSTRMRALAHDTNHPDTVRLREIMAAHIGQPVPLVGSYGASDAQFFAESGANPIVFYPEGGGHHTAGEYITEHGLLRTYELLRGFITLPS